MPESMPAPAARGATSSLSRWSPRSRFLFGYDLVIISGAQIFIRDHFHLTPGQFGFATSSALLGCVLGPSLGVVERPVRSTGDAAVCGRALRGECDWHKLANDITSFNVWRIVGGVGVGLASLASPMYIAEIAPPRRRGQLGPDVPAGHHIRRSSGGRLRVLRLGAARPDCELTLDARVGHRAAGPVCAVAAARLPQSPDGWRQKAASMRR